MRSFGAAWIVIFVSPALADPPGWDKLRDVKLAGNWRIFWNVGCGERDRDCDTNAQAKGFEPVRLLAPFGDIAPTKNNPWSRPAKFEETVRRGLRGQDGGAILVHDIEIDYDEDLDKLWSNADIRATSGSADMKAFRDAYFKQWASWYTLPCRWSKDAYPKTPVGIYGPQPFRRDYAGVGGADAQQIDGTHKTDAELWPHIEPAVDFAVVSIYCFYDDPSSLYYMAANVEENVARTKKPVYAYTWMRYHEANKKLRNKELDPWLAEAMAVVPYFSGARGVVLWGSEPKAKGQPYEMLPLFAGSLGRLTDVAEKASRAELIIDEPAHLLWKEKRPLVRKLKVSPKEWFVLVANPWQGDGQTTDVTVRCGANDVTFGVAGKRTEIYHVVDGQVRRLKS